MKPCFKFLNQSLGLRETNTKQVKFILLFLCCRYVPTALIVVITYITFLFPYDDFSDRIMVSLTALMVLAALFLQTSQGVVRTSYIKV